MENSLLKKCTRCGLEKPLNEFGTYRQKTKNPCLQCVLEYARDYQKRRRANVDLRPAIRAANKKWTDENPERVAFLKARYYAKNRDSVRAQQSDYYARKKSERDKSENSKP